MLFDRFYNELAEIIIVSDFALNRDLAFLCYDDWFNWRIDQNVLDKPAWLFVDPKRSTVVDSFSAQRVGKENEMSVF